MLLLNTLKKFITLENLFAPLFSTPNIRMSILLKRGDVAVDFAAQIVHLWNEVSRNKKKYVVGTNIL